MKNRSVNITGTISIPTNILPTISPIQIVFRELYLINSGTKIRYSRIDRRIPWQNLKHKNINDVIKNIGSYIGKKIDQDPAENNPEDIPIRYPSYLILSIKNSETHTFSESTNAVTLINRDYINCFENLIHVDANGASSNGPIGKCRLVVLSVSPLPDGAAQPIALNFNNGRDLLISVDPDIRYPGNGGAVVGDEPDPIVSPPQPSTGKKHRGK